MKTIHLFRHGLTDWNKQKKLQGHTDIPLNSEGIDQANTLKKYFINNPVDIVFSSPLDRAIKTAVLATGAEPIQIKELIEINLGDAEGVQEAELIERFGQQSLSRWRSFHPHDRNFSYPNAESKHDACVRFNNALMHIVQEYDFENAAICSHGFIMRRYFHSLIERKMGETFIPTVEEFPLIPNCHVYQLKYDEETLHLVSGPLKE